jgi:hypothetical protein
MVTPRTSPALLLVVSLAALARGNDEGQRIIGGTVVAGAERSIFHSFAGLFA